MLQYLTFTFFLFYVNMASQIVVVFQRDTNYFITFP